MTGSNTEPLESISGKHQLAAVMFTDVVSFSTRMHKDEAQTLREVAKDLQRIKEVAEKHNGRVLKTLGDGVLVHFQSATDAVRCGMEFQTSMISGFGKEKVKSPLQHRVGIHLGDMYVSDSEVMGDGVNIASRLQTIAEPGGICISQTVYDIIKNKVALKATHLGPKDLKNIAQSVNVYKIVINAVEGEIPGEIPSETSGAGSHATLTTTMDQAGQAAQNSWNYLSTGTQKVWGTRHVPLAAGLLVLLLVLGAGYFHFRPTIQSTLAKSESKPPTPPKLLNLLTEEQVRAALVGKTLYLGKVLFVQRKAIIRSSDILGLTLTSTTFSDETKYSTSLYNVALRIKGERRSYQAVLVYDEQDKIISSRLRAN